MVTFKTMGNRPPDHRFPKRINEKLLSYLEDCCMGKYPRKKIDYETLRDWKKKNVKIEYVQDYLDAADITGKELFEMCMIENADKKLNDDSWTQIAWPTPVMARMCSLLDSMTSKERSAVSFTIEQLQPAYYTDFRKRLKEVSADCIMYNTDESGVVHIPESKYHSESAEENLAERVMSTLDYMNKEQFDIASTYCKENGVFFNKRAVLKPCHYWKLFNLDDIYKICNMFQLSPHWTLFGSKDICVLAKYIQTEKIMDEFMFLPEELQEYVLAFTKMVKNGVER